jgi:hypothetical protein
MVLVRARPPTGTAHPAPPEAGVSEIVADRPGAAAARTEVLTFKRWLATNDVQRVLQRSRAVAYSVVLVEHGLVQPGGALEPLGSALATQDGGDEPEQEPGDEKAHEHLDLFR